MANVRGWVVLFSRSLFLSLLLQSDLDKIGLTERPGVILITHIWAQLPASMPVLTEYLLIPGMRACLMEDRGRLVALLKLHVVTYKPTSCGSQEFGTDGDGLCSVHADVFHITPVLAPPGCNGQCEKGLSSPSHAFSCLNHSLCLCCGVMSFGTQGRNRIVNTGAYVSLWWHGIACLWDGHWDNPGYLKII